MKHLSTLFLLALILHGFTSPVKCQDPIDYAALDELEVVPVLKIGETESYLPGVFSQLALTSDGGILARDYIKTSIEQFDPEGNHLATIATGGPGPGEIPSTSRFAGIREDTLLVNFNLSHQYSLFAPDSDGIYRYVHTLNYKNPRNGRMREQAVQSPNAIFLTTLPFEELAKQNMAEVPANSILAVDLVERDHTVIRSDVHEMNVPNPVIDLRSGTMSSFSQIPFQYRDQLRVFHDGSYILANSHDATITFFDDSHRFVKRLDLNISPRPVERTFDFSGDIPSVREAILSRIPEYKPPFLNLWVSEDHIWMQTDYTDEYKEFVVLTFNGEPVGKFYLAYEEVVHEVADNRMYVINNELEDGPAIIAYEIRL